MAVVADSVASESMEQTIVEFCRFARERGLPAGVKESLDALRAAEAVGVGERQKLKFAMRAVICASKTDWDLFEDVFEEYWRRVGAPPQKQGLPGERSTAAQPACPTTPGGTGTIRRATPAPRGTRHVLLHVGIEKARSPSRDRGVTSQSGGIHDGIARHLLASACTAPVRRTAFPLVRV